MTNCALDKIVIPLDNLQKHAILAEVYTDDKLTGEQESGD